MFITKSPCTVGSISCSYREGEAPLRPPNGSREEHFSFEVPAGTWTSRFFADSSTGANHLCHTLRPNATVNFGRQEGNSISITWSRAFRQKSHQSFTVH